MKPLLYLTLQEDTDGLSTIAHISDLHFPCTNPDLPQALLQSLRESRPVAVVVSGDLTQRAREKQFRATARFLNSIPFPLLVVPGNHDIPLYDLLRRIFLPAERFRRIICDDRLPSIQTDKWYIVGADSTRALTLDLLGFWKNGSLSDRQLELIRSRFNLARPGQLRTLVIHHPLINPWNGGSRHTVRRRRRILRVLEEAKVDLVLSGHLHKGYVGRAPLVLPSGRQVLCVQAGTATSTRLRDEVNAYNLLTCNGDSLCVTVMRYCRQVFAPEVSTDFRM